MKIMTNYRVYRAKINKYNPYWLTLIRKTKTGIDRKDWIAFIQAWKTFIEGDWDPWVNLLHSWEIPRRVKSKELLRITRGWKLTYSPTNGTGQGLSRSNRYLFNKIKATLRTRGEGKTCWACGAAPSRKLSLNAHEFWDFDFKRRVRILTAVRFLCTDCHYLTHLGKFMFLPLPDENVIRLTELFCRINNCKLTEAYTYFTFACRLENPFDTRSWKIDLSKYEMSLIASNCE